MLRISLAFVAVGLVSVSLLTAGTARATSGTINDTMNFQGRLLTAAGAVVPDGNYNIEFKIYKNGDGQSTGDTTGSPSGTLLWTEDWLNNNSVTANTIPVVIKNGYFSVQLGSITTLPSTVTLDESVLWLSMTVAGSAGATSTSCTTFSACNSSGEPEMLPMKSLSAAPYAINAANANTLGGLTSSQFIQNTTSPQSSANIDIASGNAADPAAKLQQASSATAPVLTLELGGSPGVGGDLLDLQDSSTAVLDKFDSSGNLTLGNNSNKTISVAPAASGGGSSLTLMAGNGASGTNAGGNLILEAGASTGGAAGGSIIVKPQTDSTTAFQVENASGAALLTADAANTAIVLGQDTTPTNLTVRGGIASGSNVGGGNITFQASNGTGAAGSGSFVFQTAAPGGGITLDNTSYTGGSGNITLSFTTGSGSNRLLMVQAETNASRSFSGITYNGVSMTQVATENSLTNDDGVGAHVELWYLVNPASGTHNIVATMVGSGAGSLAAASFTNVNQTTPLGTAATGNGTASGTQQSSLSVATSAGQLVIDGIGTDVPSSGVGVDSPPASGQTQLWYSANSPSLYGAAGSTAPGTGSTVFMKWNVTNADWADIAVPINPASNSTADTLNNDLVIANSGNVGIDNSSPQNTLDVSGTARVQSTTNSATAFQVQDASGSSLLDVDTANTVVNVGTAGSTAVNVGGTAGSIGRTSIGSVQDVGANNLIVGYQYTAPSTGSIGSMSAYIGANVQSSPYNQYQFALYSDNGSNAPNAYLASSAVGTEAANTWNTLPISYSVTSGTKYWLVMWTNTTNSADNAPNGDTNVASSYVAYTTGQTFGSGPDNGFPATFPTPTYDASQYPDSVYASYNSTSGPAVTVSSTGTLGVYGSAIFESGSDSTTAFQIQNASAASLFNVDTSNDVVDVGATGTTGPSTTVNIGTSSNAAQTVNLGSTDGASATTIQGGTGNVSINTGAGSGSTGSITVESGNSSGGDSGNITVDTGTNSPGGTVVEDDTFEGSGTGSVDGYTNNDSSVTPTASNTTAHGGSYSLKLTEAGSYWYAFNAGTQSVTPGHVYAFSAWVKAASTSETMSGYLYWACGDDTYHAWGFATAVSSGWTQMTGTLTAPAVNSGCSPGTETVSMGITDNTFGGSSGEIQYLDDVTVTDESLITEPSVDIGTSNAQAVNIGGNNAGQYGPTTVEGGGGISLLAGTGASVNIGTSNSNNVTVGDASDIDSTTLQGGTLGVSINTGAQSGTTGAITLESGNSSGGDSGNVNIDTGTNSPGGTQVQDDTFEGSGSGSMDGYDNNDDGLSAISASNTTAHSGSYSLKVTESSAYWFANTSEDTTVTSGHVYAFSAWVKAASTGESIDANVYWGCSIGGIVQWGSATSTSSGWTQITGTATAPALYPGCIPGDEFAQLTFGGIAGTSGQIEYIDDATITDESSITEPSVNIGTLNAQAVNIGGNNAGQYGPTTVEGGGGISLLAGSGAPITIGTGNSNNVTVGDAYDEDATTLQGGSNGVSINTGDNYDGTGSISITTGNSTSDTAGNITIDTGTSTFSGSQVEDDDFETGTDTFGCWFGCVSATQSAAEAHGGSDSLAVAEDGSGSWGVIEGYPGVAATPGHEYAFTAWVRGTAAETVSADAFFPGSVGPGDTYDTVTDSTSGWTELTGDMTAPVGATNVYLGFTGGTAGGGATDYIDDITITDLGTVSAPNIAIGGTNAQQVTIGNENEGGYTSIYGGGDGISLQTSNGGTVALGTVNQSNISIGAVGSSTEDDVVQIDDTSGGGTSIVDIGGTATNDGSDTASTVNIQGGQTGLVVANAGATLQTYTDSTTALQVQNSSGGDVLNVDTTDGQVTAGNTNTARAEQEWDSHGTNQATLSDAPQADGDLLMLAVSIPSTSVTVSSVSGGGVSSWSNATSYTDSTVGYRTEIWEGTVTGAGAGTITVNYSSTPGGGCELAAQEFSAGVGAGWSVVATGHAVNSSSTTVTFPSLTATQTGQMYWGYMGAERVGAAGSYPGFSYVPTGYQNVIGYDTDLAEGTVYTPTASQSPAGTSLGSAVIISVTDGNALTVNGAETITNTNSINALQVQNSAGTSLLGIDTVNSQETIGTSDTTTFGNTYDAATAPEGGFGAGYYWDGVSQQELVAQSFTTAGGGPLSSLSTYVGTNGISSTNKLYQMAVYSDNAGQPGTYIASTAVGNLGSSAGWKTLPITATLASDTTYWLVYWTNVNDNNNNGQDIINTLRGTSNTQMWGTYENWQCSSGCGSSTNGMPNTYPTSGNNTTNGTIASIYATFANNLPALQIDSAGNSIQDGTALFQSQTDSDTALVVNNADDQPVLQVATTFNGVGVDCSPDGNYNLTVCAGGNGNGGGLSDLGYSYQLLNVQNDGNTYLGVDSINADVQSGDLSVGNSVNNLNGPGLLVSDNFESGNFSLWSGGSSGGESVTTSEAHSGRYSAETNVSSSTGYARTSFSSTSTTFTLNAWVWAHVLPTSGELPLFTLYQASTPTNKVQLYTDQNGCLGVINGTTDLGTDSCGTFIGDDDWNNIAISINRTTGEIALYAGLGYMYYGAQGSDYTGLTIGSGWDTLDMGVTSSNTGQYWVDDLAFGTGITPSLANGLTVQDSLHASGSATFGGQVLVQPASNSATAFQVQNASGYSVLSADTSSNSGQGQVVLGSSSNNNGTLLFDNSAGSSQVGLAVTSSNTNTYTLDLPIAVPSTNQCLLSGSSTPTQLTFGSCASGSAGINNQTTTQSNANFNIQSAGAADVGGVIQGASSQTADLLDLRDSASGNLAVVSAAGNEESLGYIDNAGIGGIGQYGNLLLDSEQLDQGGVSTPPWSTNSASLVVTANNTTAPDGNTTAEKLAGTGNVNISQSESTSAVATTYTFSVWLKQSSGAGTSGLCIYSTAGTPSSCTATAVTPNSTDWQRFSVTQAVTGSPTAITAEILPGNGSTATIYAWGAQLVVGTTPEVYTRTTAAAVAASSGVVTNGGVLINSLSSSDTPVTVNSSTGVSTLKIADSGATTFKSSTNSTTAFQIQNASGEALLTADTTNTALVLGQDNTPTDLTVRGGAASGPNVDGGDITFQASNGTGAAGSGSLIFQTAPPAGGGVTEDNSGTSTASACSTATLSFTTGSGSNRLLLVGAETGAGETYTAVTYNGTSMTQLSTQDSGTTHIELWYLLNPASGAHNIVGTLSSTLHGCTLDAVSYANVNQVTPFGTAATNSGTTTGLQSTSNTVSTTSAAQVVFDVLGADVSESIAPGSGQTQLVNFPGTGGFYPLGESSAPGTGAAVNMNWAVNSADWADIGVPINPVANSTADTLQTVLDLANTGNVGIDNSNPQETLDVAGTANFQNTTNSTTAFQVQNASGANLLTADTTNNQILLGSDTNLILSGTTAYISNPQGYGDSEAFGAGASVTSSNATAVGYNASSYYDGAAVGDNAAAGGYGVALGYDAAATYVGTAVGSESDASGNYSTAVGGGAVAGSNYATALGYLAAANSADSIALGAGSVTSSANQLVIGSSTANGAYIQDAYIGSGISDIAPQSITVHATGGSGSNVAGANLSLAGGIGTGNANGGNINLQVAKPGVSGSSANTLATVASISGLNGSALFQNSTDSTAAFQVQNASGTNLLGVDTFDSTVSLGEAGSVGGSVYGKTDIGGTAGFGYYDGTSDVLAAQQFKATGGGTISSLSTYIGMVKSSPNNQGQMAIYADNGSNAPGSYIASTGVHTLTANSWNTWSITDGTASLTTGSEYWLVYWTNDDAIDGDNAQYLDTGQAGQLGYLSDYGSGVSFGTGPNNGMPATIPGGTVLSGAYFSIYATYGGSTAVPVTIGADGSVTALGAATFGDYLDSTTAFQVQNAAGANLLGIDTSGDNVNVGSTGSTALAGTINVGTSTGAAQTVNVGSNDGASATTIQGGTGNVNVLSTANITLGQTSTNAGGTLGYTGIGSNGNGCSGGCNITASMFTTTSGGTVGTMSVYVSSPASGDHYQFAIYSDNAGSPNTYIASSAVGTLTSVAGWYTLPITATLAPSTTYWITYADNSGNDGINYNSGPAGYYVCNTTFTFQSGPDNGFPASYPGGGSCYPTTQASIYATFSGGTQSAVTINSLGNLTDTGTANFEDTNDSTTAFQVQNSSNAAVLNVDTTNQALSVEASNSSSTTPTLNVIQSGTGDATLSIQDAGANFYQGVNANNGNAFTINSQYAATHNSDLGEDFESSVPNGDDQNSSWAEATEFTASSTGTMSSINVAFDSRINSSSVFSVAVYSNNAGAPGTLLGSYSGTQVIQVPNPGTLNINWNNITLNSPVSVTSGTIYWLAFQVNDSSTFDGITTGGLSAYRSGITPGTWANWSSMGTSQGNSTVINGVYAVIDSSTLSDTYANGLFSLSTAGAATFQGVADSTSALTVKNASGIQVLNVDTANSSITVNSAVNSPVAFQVQNQSNNDILTVDTTDSRVEVGPSGGGTTATLLVLGIKTSSGDPAGVTGAMYYNSNTGTFRCYQNSAWVNCIATGLGSYQVLTSTSANSTYTTPANTKAIMVEMWGSGSAGGGGGGTTGDGAAGAGGGAGGYARKVIVGPASTYKYTIAAGGTAGTAGNNAGNAPGSANCFGTNSTACSSPIISCAASTGGAGMAAGTTNAGSTGGAGGACTGGDLNTTGAAGRNGSRWSQTVALSGGGGGTLFGDGGSGIGLQGTGITAGSTVYGAGGGGGVVINSATATAGGAGAQGVIIVWEFK